VKHVQIASAAGRCAHVERGVEQSDAFEYLPPECHVGSDSDRLDADQLGVGVSVAMERSRREALAHAAIRKFEELLCEGLELERRDQAGHRIDLGIHERAGDRRKPERIRSRVVIDERDDRVARLRDAAVARPVQPRSVLTDRAHTEARRYGGALVVTGGVVHDDHFEIRIIESQERPETPLEILRTIARADDDRDRRGKGGCLQRGVRCRKAEAGKIPADLKAQIQKASDGIKDGSIKIDLPQ